MGQQSWLRLLDIEHHQVMAGTAGSMAPGFESAEALAKAKASPDYWAKQDVRRKRRCLKRGEERICTDRGRASFVTSSARAGGSAITETGPS